MDPKKILTLRMGGQLLSLERPLVMGILNVTPDSFYAPSRCETTEVLTDYALTMLQEGAVLLDIGACSTRPGLPQVPEAEELKRLSVALEAIRKVAPDAWLSVDTYRSAVARHCVQEFGVNMINDISGGQLDERLFATVAELQVPYVLTHLQGTPETMQQHPHYENLWEEVMRYFAEKMELLHRLGVNDVVIDPGFGFGKSIEENYRLLGGLEEFHVFGAPLLVGFSRKSMIYKLLNTTADEALNGTTVLNTVALMKGASILRVHDVREAAEAVRLVEAVRNQVP